ncbi:MAG TPA: hypothetical protein DFS52_03270 [Myxococcales bacterium]|nr:hypothetical protein [Myxococcales bacterium]
MSLDRERPSLRALQTLDGGIEGASGRAPPSPGILSEEKHPRALLSSGIDDPSDGSTNAGHDTGPSDASASSATIVDLDSGSHECADVCAISMPWRKLTGSVRSSGHE